MFEKKETIYKKKDRETWLAIRSLLKEQGFKAVSAGHYLQDSVMACGCGAKLDPRDFGAKGKADHDIYYIRVRLNDVQPALDLARTGAANGNGTGADAVARLPHDQREAVYLHYYEGYRISEIASLVGASEAAVTKRLSRARAALRHMLGDQS